MSDPEATYPIDRTHLARMTGRLGILQHARGSDPDPAHGYCVDDVARALQVDVLHARTLGWPVVAASAWRGLRFLEDAFDPASGRFRNFRAMDGTWLDEVGSEDSHGRALLALGDTVADRPDPLVVDAATALFERALPAARRFRFLRAQASTVLGCAAMSGVRPQGDPAGTLELLATDLHDRFREAATPTWPWPESVLTYENALLPRALIVAGRRLGSDAMTATGLEALDWLIGIQTSPEDRFSPIGNGWWSRSGERSRFDQQPIEATTLLLAAESALVATGDPRYRVAMERGHAWFLGANDVGIEVAVPERGACRDGLMPSGVNLNEGAESTLMWLIAAEHIRAARAADAGTDARTGLLTMASS